MQCVASSEGGVDDDLYDEDTRVIETHSRIGDLTDYLWSTNNRLFVVRPIICGQAGRGCMLLLRQS